jgi:hypothetical protein
VSGILELLGGGVAEQKIRRRNSRTRYFGVTCRANRWLVSRWRFDNWPCKCGRGHHGLLARNGTVVERVCPRTFWGTIYIFANREIEQDRFMRRWNGTMTQGFFDHGKIPESEQERWDEMLEERAELALSELDKIYPEIARAIREIDRKRTREVADLLWGRDEDWESLI